MQDDGETHVEELRSMRRDANRSEAYWNVWVEYTENIFNFGREVLRILPEHPNYPPSFIFELVKFYCEYILRLYSRGDPTRGTVDHFAELVKVWEAYDAHLQSLGLKDGGATRLRWSMSLDYYVLCFWLVGLALAMDVPDELWSRLVKLVGNEGEDVLLDSIISKRQPLRKIGASLCYPKAYAGLLQVVTSASEKRVKRLHSYLDKWYVGLRRAGRPDVIPRLTTPYWHGFDRGDCEGGAYFGYWCVEALAVVVAYGIDDKEFLNHPNYPGDFLEDNRCRRFPEKIISDSIVISW